jgi:hypothetical protein
MLITTLKRTGAHDRAPVLFDLLPTMDGWRLDGDDALHDGGPRALHDGDVFRVRAGRPHPSPMPGQLPASLPLG